MFIVNQFWAFVKEIFSIIALIIIFPLDLTKKNPKKEEEIDPEETPILLIHGFLGASNHWLYHRSRLASTGRKNIFTINLGSPEHSIDEYAQKVDRKIREIETLTGRDDIYLIGHSLGGLVAKEWRYKYAQHTQVKDIITIGSPLKGTYSAYILLGFFSCGREMLPGSSLIKEQEECASKETITRYYHIGSHTDLIILPNRSAYELSAPKDRVKVDILKATGHLNYLFSKKTGDLLAKYLQEHS